MIQPEQSLEQRILRLVRDEPGLTIREIAERVGASRDAVKPVVADQLAETGASRLPRARRSINRLAARL